MNEHDDEEYSGPELAILEEFLNIVDVAATAAMGFGVQPAELAGVLLARCQQLYTLGEDPDLDGLERLLEYSLEQLRTRPKFDI